MRQETPEGVELTLSPAGPIPRALAWCTDLAIRSVVYIAGASLWGVFGSGGAGIGMIVAFLLEWGYPVYFEYKTGSTPGKQALSLRVVLADGAPLTLGSAMLRNLVRFVDFFPVGYVVGLISCLFTQRFQRLGDLAAGTLVVHTISTLPRPLPETVPPRPTLLPLTLEEQRAIVAFAERSNQWSVERREELAEHSGSCTRGSPRERVEQLLGHARWIAGER
jgi:uncharacterized RDD family membrane protein YckC